ncbi:MAG: LysR family transcriptional regulator [Actinophytocola sp.]|uniref:LysR family transcriptional regulator n=1 Tax=Actinophytocola sp. TaxID=1872138 RepID=UPI001328E6EF|nr:LysR family transcriptional regulator [Actinophytocola sp.]MPZ84769.1 LysR family transcriptional regulator [Actinophytocola sp.]
MLDVRRMQVLRAVVTSGSITAAATNLGYTPSAVSQQVAALERQARTPLLERVGRGIRPTAAGRLLTEHAEIIGKHVAEAELALADLREGRTGHLSIRYFVTAGQALVPPALATLRAEHPGVQVDLKLVEPGPVPEVAQGEADVAICVLPPNPAPVPGVRFIHLLDDPYRLVLPRSHPLASRRVVELSELAEEPWVGNEWPPGQCVQVVLDACSSAGFSPGFVVESENYLCAQGFVAAGLGISLIPLLGVDRRPGVVVRKVRRPEPVRVIYAVVRESVAGQPAVRCLLDALATAAKAVAAGNR